MKDEFKDIAYELAVRTTPSAVVAWWSGLNWTAVFTGILVVLQILYLGRKWWREETEWGIRLRRWADGKFTQPSKLE